MAITVLFVTVIALATAGRNRFAIFASGGLIRTASSVLRVLAGRALGPRLIECTQLVNAIEGRSAEDIFGEIDAMKFRSCMTLFAHATPENRIFTDALAKYYAGEFDPLTLRYLRQ